MTDANREDGMLRLVKALLNVVWVAAAGLALLWLWCAAGYEKSPGISPAPGHSVKDIFMISGKVVWALLAFYVLSRIFYWLSRKIRNWLNESQPKHSLSRLIFSLLWKVNWIDKAQPKGLEMPVLEPLPIATEKHGLTVWMHSVRRWTLEKDWEYPLPKSGAEDKTVTIVIPKGFQFDGASIPRPFWGILHPSGLLLIPALVHDFAYRCGFLWEIVEEKITNRREERIVEGGQGEISPENIITRKIVEEKPGKVRRYELAERKGWDKLFRKIGADVNGVKIVNGIAYVMVRGFGCFAWKKHRKSNAECKPPDGYMPAAKDGEEEAPPPSDQEGNSGTQS